MSSLSLLLLVIVSKRLLFLEFYVFVYGIPVFRLALWVQHGPVYTVGRNSLMQSRREQHWVDTVGGHRRMEHPPAGSSRLVSNTHRTLVHIMTEN